MPFFLRRPFIYTLRSSDPTLSRRHPDAQCLAQPIPDRQAVDGIVVGSRLIARVVGRIDVDALHLSGVVREERLEREEVIALD